MAPVLRKRYTDLLLSRWLSRRPRSHSPCTCRHSGRARRTCAGFSAAFSGVPDQLPYGSGLTPGWPPAGVGCGIAVWTARKISQPTTVSGKTSGREAIRYAERLVDAGALASIGSVGDSSDNAMAEYRGCTRPNASTTTARSAASMILSWPRCRGCIGSTRTGLQSTGREIGHDGTAGCDVGLSRFRGLALRGSWRVEVLVVGLVPETAPFPADPREGAYDDVVCDDDPAGGVGVGGAVDIDEPETGGGQAAVSGDVGVLDRVDVDRRAVGVVGEGGLARYRAAVVGGGVVRGHRAVVVAAVRVDELHAADWEAGLVELSEDVDEAGGVSMVHDHLSGVRPAIEAHVVHGQ